MSKCTGYFAIVSGVLDWRELGGGQSKQCFPSNSSLPNLRKNNERCITERQLRRLFTT